MSDERQMPLEKPSEPVVDMEAAQEDAEFIIDTKATTIHGADSLRNLARAFLQLRAEVEALRARERKFLTPLPEQVEHGYTLSIMEKLLDAPEGSSGAKLAMIIAQWGLALDARKASEASGAALITALELPTLLWVRQVSEQPPSRVHPAIVAAAKDILAHLRNAALAPPAQDASEKETG